MLGLFVFGGEKFCDYWIQIQVSLASAIKLRAALQAFLFSDVPGCFFGSSLLGLGPGSMDMMA
jgi:hypothetical protein